MPIRSAYPSPRPALIPSMQPEDGIDVDNVKVPDLDTLQQALNHAVKRRNTTRFTPVG
jgi:hypothetical protein